MPLLFTTTINKKYYENLGYNYSKLNEKFIVSIGELSKGSHVQVTAICDICGKEKYMAYKTYLICVNKFGFYVCQKHAQIKYIMRTAYIQWQGCRITLLI